LIKGCSKKVIVIKDPGSNLFEEAYFIVAPGMAERKQGDLLLEANRIIAARTVPDACRRKRMPGLYMLALGFILGMTAALPTAYFLF